MILKIKKLEIDIFNWYGWHKNTNLLELWIPYWKFLNLGNCGISILPLKFWDEIGLWYKKEWRRFYLGLGFFSFFISFRK